MSESTYLLLPPLRAECLENVLDAARCGVDDMQRRGVDEKKLQAAIDDIQHVQNMLDRTAYEATTGDKHPLS